METETYNLYSIIISAVGTLSLAFAALGIFIQRQQLKSISSQIQLQNEQVKLQTNEVGQQREEIFVNSFCHFSTLYQNVMRSIPEDANNRYALKSWWYCYWDLLIAEYVFFKRGYIDPIIFELWMQELATNFNQCPHNVLHMKTFADMFEVHLLKILEYHPAIREFFAGIAEASKLQSDNRFEYVRKTISSSQLGVKC